MTRDGAYWLMDRCGSGTHVNGVSRTQHRLANGDRIEIEAIKLVFRPQDHNDLAQNDTDSDATSVLPQSRPDPSGIVYWKTPEGKEKRMSIDHPVVIGADSRCDIQVADAFISALHCQLAPGPFGVSLIDLASTNGTWYKEARINDILLPAKAVFLAGKTCFTFEGSGAAKVVFNGEPDFLGMIGRHPNLLRLQGMLKRLAPADETVLVYGETGTGKELCARALHTLSTRKNRPFISVNCAAISAELVESELFGHEKGAFTGATMKRLGAFEAAEDGTIFLDEIGELPLALQPKLLRTLDSREIKPVGSNQARYHKARVVAATNRDLLQRVREGQFREDLYYRLNTVPVHLPALRERREDIPLLAEHFLKQAGAEVGLTKASLDALIYHYWPGNVRELKNVLTTTLWYHPEIFDIGEITEEHLEINFGGLSDTPKSPPVGKNSYHGQTLQDAEAQLIREALSHFGNNKRMAARALSISKSTLYEKMKRYGID
jgi:transcriptional regulator with AAA-type ATPase domain